MRSGRLLGFVGLVLCAACSIYRTPSPISPEDPQLEDARCYMLLRPDGPGPPGNDSTLIIMAPVRPEYGTGHFWMVEHVEGWPNTLGWWTPGPGGTLDMEEWLVNISREYEFVPHGADGYRGVLLFQGDVIHNGRQSTARDSVALAPRSCPEEVPDRPRAR